ncbi:helix-turn-helix transcriptional regulator [Arthrobacter sp. TMN-37]
MHSTLSGAITAATAREITGNLYLTRRECAAYMGVSEKFLATHLSDGPPRRLIGSKVIYRLSDVDRWMDHQVVTN